MGAGSGEMGDGRWEQWNIVNAGKISIIAIASNKFIVAVFVVTRFMGILN
jgi:hypothetical protein